MEFDLNLIEKLKWIKYVILLSFKGGKCEF